MTTIKNLVFDVGGILVDERDGQYMQPWAELFTEGEFKAIEKNLLLGNLAMDDLVALATKKHPKRKYEFEMATTMEAFVDKTPIKDGVLRLVSRYKQKGYDVYLLSNATDCFRNYVTEFIAPCINPSGMIFSCDIGLMKPDMEIYRRLLGDFGLKSEETVFFDNEEENAAAAALCGINGFYIYEESLLKTLLQVVDAGLDLLEF